MLKNAKNGSKLSTNHVNLCQKSKENVFTRVNSWFHLKKQTQCWPAAGNPKHSTLKPKTMQNKANLQDATTNVNFFITIDYDDLSAFGGPKNKPNRSAPGRKSEALNSKT